jgi:hypothetical protein
MAIYKRAELRNAVLTEVGVLDGQSTQGNPSPEDAKLATEVCQQELEYLFGEGYLNFDPDSDKIPAAYFRALVWYIAPAVMVAFGVINRAQALALQKQEGFKRLAALKESRYLGTTQQAEYF